MISLQKYLQQQAVPDALLNIIVTFTDSCKDIALRIRQGAITGILGTSENQNIQGETQKQLDILSNQLIKEALLSCTSVLAMASEEEENIVSANAQGEWLVAFDPLDGSSNIDINGQVGTIFSIYPARKDLSMNHDAQFQQQGLKQACAGYVLYGPSCQLAITTGNGTDVFTLDVIENEFLLTNAEINIPADTNEFAVNASNQRFWSAKIKCYIQNLLLGDSGPREKNFNMRWNGAMVGDVHRILMRGGIFLYPADNRNAKQSAKLRLLYEANPMAMLIENAGGKAFSENQRILDIIPHALHQRVAVVLGSANEVDVCLDQTP